MPERTQNQREADDQWYRLVATRTAKTLHLTALALSLLITGTQWGHWFGFVVSIVLIVVSYPLNVVYDRYVSARVGAKSELFRVVFNSMMTLPAFHLMHWPLAVWFWLPFTAITVDQSTNRHGFITVLACTLLHSSAALLAGVEPLIAVSFTMLALVVWKVASIRGTFLRDMIHTAQAQHEELARAHAELQQQITAREQAELNLRQAQKLEAMGRLAAGVAHEINTPMQFVSDHLRFVSESTSELMALAQKLATPEDAAAADLEYLEENVPAALAHAAAGVQRVADIVRSMKEFTHPGGGENAPVDLNHAIQNTLTISSYEYKLVADIETDLGDIPHVHGNANELNQVLLNLIVNAAHAIGDVARLSGGRGKILIRSRQVGERVEIIIRDTGGGIRGSVKMKVFEPFFTTKSVGRGTGQGLAISRAVIERHGGEITFESVVGKGTTFTVRLPVSSASQTAVPTAA